jgi:hypothetical protein
LTVDLSFLKSSEDTLNPLQDDGWKHLLYRSGFILNEKSFETKTCNKTEIAKRIFEKKCLQLACFSKVKTIQRQIWLLRPFVAGSIEQTG